MRIDRCLTGAALAALGLIVVAPLFTEGSILHEAFAPFCHQMPTRSPALLGVTLPVCWRCLGVLVGLAALGLAWRHPAIGDSRGWPWLLGLGVGDFALSQLGLVADVGVERLVSGICIGFALPLALRGGWKALSRVHLEGGWRGRARLSVRRQG